MSFLYPVPSSLLPPFFLVLSLPEISYLAITVSGKVPEARNTLKNKTYEDPDLWVLSPWLRRRALSRKIQYSVIYVKRWGNANMGKLLKLEGYYSLPFFFFSNKMVIPLMACSRAPEVAMTNTWFTFSLPSLTFVAMILSTFILPSFFLSISTILCCCSTA